jgi:hypothetical protein
MDKETDELINRVTALSDEDLCDLYMSSYYAGEALIHRITTAEMASRFLKTFLENPKNSNLEKLTLMIDLD